MTSKKGLMSSFVFQFVVLVILMTLGYLQGVPVDVLYVVMPLAVTVGFMVTSGMLDDMFKNVPVNNPMRNNKTAFKIFSVLGAALYIFVRAIPVIVWPTWWLVFAITALEFTAVLRKPKV